MKHVIFIWSLPLLFVYISSNETSQKIIWNVFILPNKLFPFSRYSNFALCASPFFTSFDYCWIHKTSWLKIDRKSYGVMMPLNRNSKTKDIYTCEKFYLKDVQKMCSIDESEVSLRKRIFNEDWRRSSKILQKFNLISVSFDRIMTQKF